MPSTQDPDNPFVDWLLAELAHRRWTRQRLAQEAGVYPSVIAKVVHRESALGVDLAKKIADALDVRQRTVFVIAGLIDDEETPQTVEDEEVRQLNDLLARVSADKRRELLKTFRAILETADIHDEGEDHRTNVGRSKTKARRHRTKA